MPKKKCPPAGAPEWVLTYGDMMSLLLTFFILLAALSEIKKEDEYSAIVKEVKRAFGMRGGGGHLPTKEDPTQSLIQKLQSIQTQNETKPTRSNTDDPGVEGREQTVTTIRKGMLFVVGGPIVFEPGSAELSERGRRSLDTVVSMVRGFNNKLEVRGHAAPGELSEASGPYRDLWDLSYARSKAVMDYLTHPQQGIDPRRIRVIGCADQEPQKMRVYTTSAQQPNRRVEVVVSEELVEDLQPSAALVD